MADARSPVLTVAQMLAAEQAMFDTGLTVDALMLRAGQAAGEMIWRIGGDTPTLILCGPGNNGGDGYVIAEHLRRKGVAVSVAALAEPRTEAARTARADFSGEVVALDEAIAQPQIVDCLFGSGLSRPIDDRIWTRFSALVSKAGRSFAMDVVSGVDADRACWLNHPLVFDHVLALGAWKYAHLLEPVASCCRSVSLIDIGIDIRGAAGQISRLSQPVIARPGARAHKYNRGLVLVLAGAMPGAALLAGRAAQAAGAGYVRIIGNAAPPPGLPADLVWQRLDGPEALAEALADPRIGAVLAGPGLGRDADAAAMLDAALACPHPLVLDADALHLLAHRPGTLPMRAAPAVLTPHHGEFMTLAGAMDLPHPAINKLQATVSLARRLNSAVLYKGADTVIAAPDGSAIIADRRCSWLSVAGSGDVLAGCIAARLASKADPLPAMAEAVWLQDRAARLAGAAFTASQLAQTVSQALEQCLER